MKKINLAIATIKSWNITLAHQFKEKFKKQFEVLIITAKNDLNMSVLQEFSPKYIFFPHWSWSIPEEIYNNYECVIFHITDLPYGKGGSPLQNLIINKIYKRKISAIRVVKEIDAGEIYQKEDFYIGLGSVEEIFPKVSEEIYLKMIPDIVKNNPRPYVQKGVELKFKRRLPEESNMNNMNFDSLQEIYDYIRCLMGKDIRMPM